MSTGATESGYMFPVLIKPNICEQSFKVSHPSPYAALHHQGSEERDGSGKCSCDKGYKGDRCQRCSKGYFNDTDEDKFTCQGMLKLIMYLMCNVTCSMPFYAACDKACKDSCSGDGPDMCDECADGYELNEEEDACKGNQ